jgi:hypothetical protein
VRILLQFTRWPAPPIQKPSIVSEGLCPNFHISDGGDADAVSSPLLTFGFEHQLVVAWGGEKILSNTVQVKIILITVNQIAPLLTSFCMKTLLDPLSRQH